MSSTRTIKLCEAIEMGKVSQELVHGASGSINRLSDHQQHKAGVRNNKKEKAPGGQESGCSNCGSKGYSSKLKDRRECKAFHEDCNKCRVVGHFKAQCRSGTTKAKDNSKTNKSKVAGVQESKEPEGKSSEPQGGAVGTLSGSWMALNSSTGNSSAPTTEESFLD